MAQVIDFPPALASLLAKLIAERDSLIQRERDLVIGFIEGRGLVGRWKMAPGAVGIELEAAAPSPEKPL